MKHQDVASSNIKSIGYCPDSKTLEVIFHNGGHYCYEDVSAEKHKELMEAKSLGSHLAQHIKLKHGCTKLK